MGMELEYKTLIKKILDCNSMDELRNVVIDSNNFLKKHEIPKNSKIFEKLDTLIGIVKINLKQKGKFQSLDESQIEEIIKNILKNENISK
jgi:restriction endonuclease